MWLVRLSILFLFLSSQVALAYQPTVSGTVAVSNFPSTQTVSGTVSLPSAQITALTPYPSVGRTWGLSFSTDSVSATQQGAWNVGVNNFPSGFNVLNFPSSQAVTGTFWQATQPVSAASLPLPSGAATSDLQTSANSSLSAIEAELDVALSTRASESTLNTFRNDNFAQMGGLTETAPASDTASSGLNGRLQRIAQRLSTLIATLPASLGQTTMSGSQPVAIASDQSAIPVSQPDTLIVGQAAQTAVVNNILTSTAGTAAVDASGIRSASIQVVSTGTGGTFIFENSNDNVNFQPMPVFNSALTTSVPIVTAITATSSQIIYTLPVRARYIRLRIATTITGGSIQAFSRLSQESWSPAVQAVGNSTAANLQATLAANQSVNAAQINGVAPLMGAGPTGTGSIRTTEANVAAATLTNVASSATNVTCLASAAARIGAIFYNDSTSIAYLKYGATASTTSYTVQIPANGTHVMQSPLYSGIVDCIWAAANGNMRVTAW